MPASRCAGGASSGDKREQACSRIQRSEEKLGYKSREDSWEGIGEDIPSGGTYTQSTAGGMGMRQMGARR